jgi:ferredoxin
MVCGMSHNEKKMGERMTPFKVDQEKCNRDGLCVEECPARVIRLRPDDAVPVPEAARYTMHASGTAPPFESGRI